MSDHTNDINELLALFERLSRSTSGLLFERRHHALTALLAERDEARRDCCAFEGILRFNEAHPNGIISQEATLRLANEIAVERGWDCFDAKEVKP